MRLPPFPRHDDVTLPVAVQVAHVDRGLLEAGRESCAAVGLVLRAGFAQSDALDVRPLVDLAQVEGLRAAVLDAVQLSQQKHLEELVEVLAVELRERTLVGGRAAEGLRKAVDGRPAD